MESETITNAELEQIGLRVKKEVHACDTCRYFQDAAYDMDRICKAQGGRRVSELNPRANCCVWEPSDKELARRAPHAISRRSVSDRLVRGWSLLSFIYIVVDIILRSTSSWP